MTEHAEMATSAADIDTQLAVPPAWAWSEEVAEKVPAVDYGRYSLWRKLLRFAKLAIVPAILMAVVAVYVFSGDHQGQTPVITPPTSAVAVQPPIPPAPAPGPVTIDEKFVAALINHGAQITHRTTAVHNAHAACGELERGVDRSLVSDHIRDATDGYNDERAAIFVALSALFYCPMYAA